MPGLGRERQHAENDDCLTSRDPAPEAAARDRSTPLDYPKNVERSLLLMADQLMAGLAREMRHIDYGQRVGAFQDENSANWNDGKRLFCTQHGNRTVQSA